MRIATAGVLLFLGCKVSHDAAPPPASREHCSLARLVDNDSCASGLTRLTPFIVVRDEPAMRGICGRLQLGPLDAVPPEQALAVEVRLKKEGDATHWLALVVSNPRRADGQTSTPYAPDCEGTMKLVDGAWVSSWSRGTGY